MKNGVRLIGYFNTENDAHEAYKTAKINHASELAIKYRETLNKQIYKILTNFNLEQYENN